MVQYGVFSCSRGTVCLVEKYTFINLRISAVKYQHPFFIGYVKFENTVCSCRQIQIDVVSFL